MSKTTNISGPHADCESRSLATEVHQIRRDFPILDQKAGELPLAYLDNAATSHKPTAVIDAIERFYLTSNSNINRGVHALGERATEQYEQARTHVQNFINAARSDEIVFVRGVTEAANLVAAGFGRKFIASGDEIIITEMEHHSNIVPWQMLSEEKGAHLKVIPVNDEGDLALDKFAELVTERTRLVCLAHVSNVLGTVNPLGDIIKLARQRNIPVFVDGAQAAPHIKVDVQEMGCDFYAFSGHKLYGPTGIGVLYGKAEMLEKMSPYQVGGGAIKSVRFSATTYQPAPAKFEAGTPNIAGAIGLGAAINYLNRLGLEPIADYEQELLEYAMTKLSDIPGLRLFGNPRHRVSIISFVVTCAHAHDVASMLDSFGIAIRAGHHCAQPLHERFGIGATARASLAFYNLKEEIDRLAEGIYRVKSVFE